MGAVQREFGNFNITVAACLRLDKETDPQRKRYWGGNDYIFVAYEFTIIDEGPKLAYTCQPVARKNQVGQPVGEADVMFANVEDARNALGRDRALMGLRYVELFSTLKK